MRTCKATTWILVVVLLQFVTAGRAQASAYYFSDIGVRSFSRGGAFIAGVDDLTALYYNPAALTRLKRGQVMLDVAGVQQFVSYSRADFPGNGPLDANGDMTDIAFDTVTNAAPPYAIPHLGVSHTFGLPNTTFAFGFYPPYAPDLSYPDDGPQRYSLIDTEVIQTVLGPSIAHEFLDWFSLGAGVSWNVLYVEQELKISVPTNDLIGFLDESDEAMTAIEDPAYDVAFRMDAYDGQGVGWNLGLLIEPPTEKWALGMMFQAPVQFCATGQMEADFSEHVLYTDGFANPQDIITQAIAKDDFVTLEVTMPLILKGGFALRPSDRLEVEIASVWQNWSSIDAIVVSDLNMVIDLNEDFFIPLEDAVISDDVVLPAGYKNSWSVRLGGDFDFSDRWTARAGGFVETSAIPDESQTVALVDGNKVGYGVGGSWFPNNKWAIDLGLSQSFLASRDISGSHATQISINPMSGEFNEGTVAGDGSYQSSLLLFGLGLNWFFD